MARKNDVLMSVRAPVGDLNVAYEDCCIGRGLASIHSSYPSFCLYLMRSLRTQLDSYNGEGTVFGSINGKALKALSIGLPDGKAIRDFERLVGPLDAEIRSNETESRRLTALRDSLLPKLMSGEVDVSKVEVPTPPNSHLYLSGNPTTEVEHGLVKKAVRAPVVVHLGMFVQESIDPSLEVVQELPQVEVDFEKAIGFQIPLHLLDAVAAGRHLVEDPELYDIEGRLVPFNMRCIDALVKIHTAQLIAVVARKVAGKT